MRRIIERFRSDKRLSNRVFAISVVTALFVLVMVVQSFENNGQYLVDRSGNVVAINRTNTDSIEEFDFNLIISKGKDVIEKPIRITKQSLSPRAGNGINEKEQNRLDVEAELNGMISGIELSDKKRITLPNKLSDGSKLTWRMRKTPSGSYVIIPIIYCILIVLAFKSSIDEEQSYSVQARQAIMKGLPRFTNQLMLMMNAGMILSDAFERIANSYTILGLERMGFWEKALVKLAEDNRNHRESTATVISNFASENNVKELARIATVLTENEKRGSNVIDNLTRESRYLWDDRKIVAREKGKMIDTKMSYPMAMLLILLIVITMAPAILNM